MKITGNLLLCFAFLLLVYPLIPNLPWVRASIGRSRGFIIGPLYLLFFVLVPCFFRRLFASLAMWSLLIAVMAIAVGCGGFDWIGIGRIPQCLLIGAAGFAMAEISVLSAFARGYFASRFQGIVRLVPPWVAWIFPLIVMVFAVVAINPAVAGALSPWVYRGPLIGAFLFSLPIGSVLLARWITPSPLASRVTLNR